MMLAMVLNHIKHLVAAAFLLAFLSGCYAPASFDAEIEINRKGFYRMSFEGYMVETNLFNKVVHEKIDHFEEKERVERLKTDITRDKATKLFEYFKKGHFRIKWEKQGDLLQSKMVMFLRRNENIISLKYVKKHNLVTIQGTPLSKAHAQRMVDSGLGMQGNVRVITDAKVKSHNAQSVTKGEGRNKIYSWKITSPFSKSPKLTFVLR